MPVGSIPEASDDLPAWDGSGHPPISTPMGASSPSAPQPHPPTWLTAPPMATTAPDIPPEVLQAQVDALALERTRDRIRRQRAWRNMLVTGIAGALASSFLALVIGHVINLDHLVLLTAGLLTAAAVCHFRLGYLLAVAVYGLPNGGLLMLVAGPYASLGALIVAMLLALWCEERRSVGR